VTVGLVDVRVLVVEDDEPLLGLACAILRGAGYDVIPASNATEALDRLDDPGLIDCLFTDVVLPDLSGIDLASAFTAARPDLPVVFTTGQSDAAIHDRIQASGHPLLLKPYTADRLCDIVHHAHAPTDLDPGQGRA